MDGTNDNFKKNLASLFSYISTKMGIKETPKVIISDDKKNAMDPYGKTAYYDHNSKTIRLYITDRLETDILRSFSHECIHFWQDLSGTLNPDKKAGIADSHYAQYDLNLRKREMEAYLFGNILYRDWQDEKRYGPPKQAPQLPEPINEIIDSNRERWIQSMVSTIEDDLIENGEKSTDVYHAYDILKSGFRAEAPDHKMFEKAAYEAINILKGKGKVR